MMRLSIIVLLCRPSRDAATKSVNAGGLFRLPRSLTDAGGRSCVAVFWTTPGRFQDPEDGHAPREQLIVVGKPIAADHGDTQGNGFAIGWSARLEARGCGQRQFQVWHTVAYYFEVASAASANGRRCSALRTCASSQYAGHKQ